MAIERKDIVDGLEEIIFRLEETRNDALEYRDSSDMGFHDSSFDSETSEMMEHAEAAIFEAGNCIDEMIQIIGEEIDNLRGIVANLE